MAQSTQADLRALDWGFSDTFSGKDPPRGRFQDVTNLRRGTEVLGNPVLSARSILEFAFLSVVP